ncbi:MAG: SRPBCC family protein [Gammaproteobacteria bacterium]|nr:SRPBCC family protein [Gammaproteobacteria bacterium]
MKVNLDKTFPISAPASTGWAFLQDIPAVAGCMPGAQVTEVIDEQHYKGSVTARIGPATMAFNGDIEIQALDPDSRMLHMLGSGQDSKGASSAVMDLKARIVETDNGDCELKGEAVVTVNGKAASLGGRMMTQVADQILNQFGRNFTNHVVALSEAEASGETGAVPVEQAKALNGLAFAWSILVGWLRSLFGSRQQNSR